MRFRRTPWLWAIFLLVLARPAFAAQPPVANSATYQLALGGTFTAILTGSDPNDQPLTFAITTLPTSGTAAVTSATTGAFFYAPHAGFSGTDSLTFTATETGTSALSGTGTITFVVEQRAPVALSGTYTVDEGAVLTGTLSSTDPNIPPDLTYAISGTAALGIVAITNASLGTFTYTSTAGKFGRDTFSFIASDGTVASAPATVAINVRPLVASGRVLATDDQSQSLLEIDPATGRQGVITSGSLVQDGRGIALDPSGRIWVIDGTNGLEIVRPLTGGPARISPASNFSTSALGPAGIALEADGTVLVAGSGAGLVRVNPLNGIITPLVSATAVLATGVAVADDGTIYLTDASALASGVSRVVTVDPVSGAVTPISTGTNLNVPIGITIQSDGKLLISDAGSLNSGTDQVIRIDPGTGNQTVVSSGGQLDVPLDISIANNGNIFVPAQSANSGTAGILLVNGTSGATQFVSQGGSLQNPWGVLAVNAPTISQLSGTTTIAENAATSSTSVTVENLGETAGLLVMSASSNNTNLVPNTNVVFSGSGNSRSFVVTPAALRSGTATIGIIVSNGFLTASTQFTLVVTHVNTPPIAVNDQYSTPQSVALVVSASNGVLANDTDPQNLPLTAILSGSTSHGALALTSSNGAFTYTPDPGFVGIDSFTYFAKDSLLIQSATTATVSIVVHAVPVPAAASYAGFMTGITPLFGDPLFGNAGSFTISTTPSGAFTGKLTYGGKTYSFKGAFDPNGNATVTINRSAILGPLTLNFNLNTNNGPDEVALTVNDNNNNILTTFTAYRLIYSKTNPAPVALSGTYTVLIPPATTGTSGTPPLGYGYATMTVSAAGAVKLAGALGDGTPFTYGTSLSREGIWGLFISLYKKTGYISGTVTFENESGSDMDGGLVWVKLNTSKGAFQPSTFVAYPALIGSRYAFTSGTTALIQFTPVPTVGAVSLTGGNLASAINSGITLNNSNLIGVSGPNSENLALKIKTSTGAITGSFTPPGGKKTTINGVIYQKSDEGDGVFKGSTEAGAFELGSP